MARDNLERIAIDAGSSVRDRTKGLRRCGVLGNINDDLLGMFEEDVDFGLSPDNKPGQRSPPP